MNRKQKLRALKLKAKSKIETVQRTKPQQPKDEKDERFERVSYDPRFIKVPNKISKVKIDKRFRGMMTDDRFKLVSNVDKYGRKIKTTEENQQLKDFYYEDEMETQQKPKGHDRDLRQWMENYDEESDTDSDIEYEQQQEKQLWDDDKNVIKGEHVEVTRRLALCNYDWMKINARDLMPTLGSILSVTVYPSEIGLKKLKQEERHGPRGIWNDEDGQEAPINKQKDIMAAESKKQSALNLDKLRQYEKQRLKYYYAVIECDSAKTAEQIYKACDGNQFENAGQMDLRYVPDDLQFPHQPKDFCDQLPSKGQVKNYINRALGHSHVALTWEDPELNTIAGLKKNNWSKMTDKQLENIDWSLYLNDDEMSEEDKQVQAESDDVEIPQWKKEMRKDMKNNNDDEIMEIRFESGFDLAKKIKDRQEEQKMSSYELYKKKRKEKRSQRLQQKKRIKQQSKAQLLERDYQKQRRKLELLVDSKKHKEDFKPDVEDTRFGAVYSNPLYSIDPTSHHFKVTKNTRLLGQVVKRKRNTSQ